MISPLGEDAAPGETTGGVWAGGCGGAWGGGVGAGVRVRVGDKAGEEETEGGLGGEGGDNGVTSESGGEGGTLAGVEEVATDGGATAVYFGKGPGSAVTATSQNVVQLETTGSEMFCLPFRRIFLLP